MLVGRVAGYGRDGSTLIMIIVLPPEFAAAARARGEDDIKEFEVYIGDTKKRTGNVMRPEAQF